MTEIYMKNQYKSSRIKNHKITFFFFFLWGGGGGPLKGFVASLVIFRFGARNKEKKYCGNIQKLMTLKFHNITNM